MSGSGFTSKRIITQLQEVLTKQYRANLLPFTQKPKGHGNISKAKLEDLVSGFEDGQRTLLHHLCEMGIVVITDHEEVT